jgi:hypothetical protein
MTKKEAIRIACIAINKRLDYEELMYSDDMYNKTKYIDQVWGYVSEASEIGLKSFRIKYREYDPKV